MHCLSCGHDNRADARFCGGCGMALHVPCAACGHRNAPDNRFCDACGAAMPSDTRATPRAYTPAHLAEKILTTRSALEGERKQVTVLFCDLANSTDLARRVGAEAMHELLNGFFELALGQVHRFEGTINQFLGDGFMALFGAPLAHEDHVRRALLSALGIRQRLRDATADPSSPLVQVRLRMGLNTGPVVVGKIGDNLRMDYTAIGDTTNIAARLQALARPGAICVGEGVQMAGQPYFEFAPLGRQALKGISEPQPVYEVVKARSREAGGTQARSLGIASPLVGRDHELEAVASAFAELERGEGGVLVLTGEPGAGKSRLMAEIRRQRGSDALLWLEGRALSFGRNLSYWPFIEVLKSCFGIAEDDTEDLAWRKLHTGLADLFGDRGDDMLPYLATMLAVRVPAEHEERIKYLDGLGLKRQIFLCMRQLFERLAQRQPVVLLLEDWHWADQSSIELAEHVLPLTLAAPLLAFFPTRTDPAGPADQVRQFAAQHPQGHWREIVLSPLTPEQSAELVANLVGAVDLPGSLRDQILRKTEGNPFFIEEVIRSLVTEGVLVRHPRDNVWQLGKRVEQVNLPDTLQGLILARIDRLDEEVKQALKLASVVGRSFFDRVLASISQAQAALPAHLTELEHAELIREKQRLPEPEHIFKHALVQEAAYGSILADNRRAIHRRVAQAIEALFNDRLDEFSSLLAHHYTCAEDWDKAQEYLFKAGDQAGRIAADAEALEHFRQAEAAYLKVYGDKLSPLQRASLARKIGAALYGTGHYEQAHEHLRQALAQLGLDYPTSRGGIRRAILKYLGAHFMRRLRRGLGLPARRDMDAATATEISTIAHFMAWMDYFLDKERMLLDSLLELHVGELSHYGLAEARGLSSLGFGFMTFNARRLSRKYHHEAVAVAQRSANPSAISFAWFALGFLDFYDGQWDECESRLGKAVDAYRESGDIHRWGGATLMLSFVVYFRGHLEHARELTSDLIRAGQDAADPQVASWGYQNLAYVNIAQGPLDEAAASLREGQALAIAIPAWDNLLYQKALLAKCLVLQGKADEARAELDEAHRIIETQKLRLPYDQIEVLTADAEVRLAVAESQAGAARQAALREARSACAKALRCAEQMPLWLPQALRCQGTADWLCGNPAQAQKHWRQSVAVAESAAFPIERARTMLEMGRRSGEASLVELASEVFRQTGANTFHAFALQAKSALQARDMAGTGAAAHPGTMEKAA